MLHIFSFSLTPSPYRPPYLYPNLPTLYTTPMKTVLVTGASGFAGSHFIEKYAEYFKILATWNTNPISNTKALTIQLNMLNKEELQQTILRARPDVILHLAGKAKTWGDKLENLMQDNYQTTKNILDSVIEIKEKEITDFNPRIVIITSAEIYGKTINPKSIDENSPFFPCNDYGLSKVMVDRLAYLYAKTRDLNVVILRTFNHSGPGQKLGFFISDMASQIVKIEKGEQQNLEVGNLSSIRDVLDVRDVIDAYFKAIESDLPSGEAYNICSGKGSTMQKLLDQLLKYSTKKITTITDQTRLRPSDNPIVVGNNKKFFQATKWKPRIPLEKTLKDSLEYWRSELAD